MNATFKAILFGLALSAPLAASASEMQTATAQPWSPSTLRQALAAMPEGSAARGEALHTDLMCNSCHGAAGVAPTRNYPDLAGQRDAYTYKMLLDYKSGLRDEGKGWARVMTEIAQLLDEQGMADLSAYYASLDLPPAKSVAADGVDVQRLVQKGDPTRLLTPCASCHGRDGEGGLNETPALAGQNPHYLVRTLKAYRAGARDNDAAQGMAQFAKVLSDAEIQALAAHYAAIPPRP